MTTSPSFRRRVVVMVKVPHPGRVKTRLGREIGMVVSAWWFRHQATRLFRRIQDPRWETILYVTPDREGLHSRVWPVGFRRIAQGQGDLGKRMEKLFSNLPPGPALIVGADIPGITRQHIARAFGVLGQNDAVFGPAPDGGYWLIGFRHGKSLPARAFSDVRWSGPYAMDDTIASLGHLRIAFTDTLADVDCADDLDRNKSDDGCHWP